MSGRKPGYYHYGEGSIHHNGHPCGSSLPGDRHPAIQRDTYRSFWHYRWTLIARWLWERRFFVRMKTYEKGGKTYFTFGKVGNWLMAQGLPQVPHIMVCFKPEDSIYDRSTW